MPRKTRKSGSSSSIDVLLHEERVFRPDAAFRRQANVKDESLYVKAARDPKAFWASCARDLVWLRPWKKVLMWNPPRARWFVGGKLNASVNCLDRHLTTPVRNKAAILWEGEPGEERTLTYAQLFRETCRFANVLKDLGGRKGDRVTLYMPLVPELAIAMLACARIGAVHSVVFGGFSAESLKERINDADRKSTRLNSSHSQISYAVFCLKKKITDRARGRVGPPAPSGR